jgi:nitrogen fixation-related uncharacterized protein
MEVEMLLKISLICLGTLIMFLAWYLSSIQYSQHRNNANTILYAKLVTKNELIDPAFQKEYGKYRTGQNWSVARLSIVCGLAGLIVIILAFTAF